MARRPAGLGPTVAENGHLPIQAGEVLWTGERPVFGRSGRAFGTVLTFTVGVIATLLAVAVLAARARY